MDAPPTHLQSHLGYWLRLVSNQVSYAFARRVASCEVTVAEWVVLREMFDSGSTAPSALAELTGLTRGAISKLIDRLLIKKLVSRKEAKDDRRFQSVALTAAGRDLVPRLARLADQNDAESFAPLTPEEKLQLLSLLQKIAGHHQWTSVPID